MGKSRLTWEFTRSHHADGWLVLRGRSISYARGTPYWPVIELLKSYLQSEERDVPARFASEWRRRLLTLDRTLEALLTPLLALFDVPVSMMLRGMPSTLRNAGSVSWTRSRGCLSGKVR